jgi:hypothetical protein
MSRFAFQIAGIVTICIGLATNAMANETAESKSMNSEECAEFWERKAKEGYKPKGNYTGPTVLDCEVKSENSSTVMTWNGQRDYLDRPLAVCSTYDGVEQQRKGCRMFTDVRICHNIANPSLEPELWFGSSHNVECEAPYAPTEPTKFMKAFNKMTTVMETIN